MIAKSARVRVFLFSDQCLSAEICGSLFQVDRSAKEVHGKPLEESNLLRQDVT